MVKKIKKILKLISLKNLRKGFIIKRLKGNAHVRDTLRMADEQATALFNKYGSELETEKKIVIQIV